ncbi:MAG: hypothetical protein HY905_20180 [Deltaproteobacteria bacterium]|nr:hypothetical protein [Deltaproteobacteria bacterium]
MVRWNLWLLPVAAGCGMGGAEWRGDEAAVSVTWTIAGEPASPASCAALGATSARLVVRVGEGRWLDPDLVWSCATGAAATGPIFAVATLDFTIELLDPLDRVTAFTPWTRRTVGPGDNVLGNFDLRVEAGEPDASLDVRWTVGGTAASAASCGAVGAEDVRLDWRIGLLAGEPFTWPCADGSGRVELGLRSGLEIDFRLRLLDGDGFVLASAPRASWYVATLAAGDNELESFALTVDAVRGPLTALLYWGDRVGSGATYVECAAAGVARVGYRLEDGGGAVVDELPVEEAPSGCTDVLAWPALPPDTYTLVVQGEDDVSGGAWSAECWGLDVTDSEDNSFVCRVPRLR